MIVFVNEISLSLFKQSIQVFILQFYLLKTFLRTTVNFFIILKLHYFYYYFNVITIIINQLYKLYCKFFIRSFSQQYYKIDMISSSSSAIKITLFDYTAICYTNFYDEQNQQGQLNEIDIKWLTSQPQKPQKIRRLKLYQMYKIQIARNGVFQVALDNRLPNQKQLEQIFLNNYKQYKNDGGSYELDEVQLQNAILFDYFQYIRTCEYIYKDKQIEKNIKTKNPKILLKYLKEMKEYYVKQKIKTLLKYFEQQKFDILFMEKALPLSQQMLKQLLQNRLLYFEKKNDVVLIKKQNFNKNLLVFKKSYFSQFISLISQLNNDYQIISLKIKLLKTRQNKILYNRSKQQFFKQSYVVEVGQQSYKKQVQKIEQVQQEFFTQTNGDLKCYEQTFKLVKK